MPDALNKDLTKRTPGEELWLWRQALGYSGIKAADYMGIGRNRYWSMEADRIDAAFKYRGDATVELLFKLARRRTGWGLRETARRVGVSHVTLLTWERMGDQTLMDWWVSRGFTFG